LTKTDLANAVAKSTGLSKKASGEAVNAVFSAIEESLAKGEKVQLVGFGTFEVRERAARQGRNPQDPSKVIRILRKKYQCSDQVKHLKKKCKRRFFKELLEMDLVDDYICQIFLCLPVLHYLSIDIQPFIVLKFFSPDRMA